MKHATREKPQAGRGTGNYGTHTGYYASYTPVRVTGLVPVVPGFPGYAPPTRYSLWKM